MIVAWVIALFIAGTGVGIAWPHLSAWIMGAVDDPVEGGAAAAAINTVQLISGAFGAGLAGVVVNMTPGGDVATARWLFGVFAALAAIGVVCRVPGPAGVVVESRAVDAFSAGRLSRTLDRLHSSSTSCPKSRERFGRARNAGQDTVLRGRSAPMGAVGARWSRPRSTTSTPTWWPTSIPAAWQMASPETVTRIRYEIVEHALPRVLGESLATSAELARAADVLCRVAESVPDADGRPLYAGHAELPWPQSPHSRLWHAITLLREYRGDGHIAALITYGLSGLEALITHTASGIGFTVEFARRLRGWSEEQWAARLDRLRQARSARRLRRADTQGNSVAHGDRGSHRQAGLRAVADVGRRRRG